MPDGGEGREKLGVVKGTGQNLSVDNVLLSKTLGSGS